MASTSNASVRHRTIGIDLAIRAVQVAQVFDDGRAVGKPIRFRLTSTDLKRFVFTIKNGITAETPITAVMEPTGMAWFPVANWLQRAGIRVIRVKGQRVKALRKYLSEHAKTDTADAHVLGAIPGFGGRGLDPVHVPVPEQHTLQRLTKQRHRYQELVCSARRRVLDLIRWACPALEPVLPNTVTQLTLAILGELFNPREVAAMRRDVLARFLSRNASGNHPKSGPFIDSMVEKLKSAATETIELHGDSVDFVALQFEVAQEVEHLRLWDRHIGAIEREVERIYQRVHPSDALRSIPGIGSTLAPLLIGILGHALVDAGYRVLFMRTSEIVQKLQAAWQNLQLPSALAKLERFDLIILDDLSYARKDQAETSVLFELIAERYERRSLLITANQPFSGWNDVFPDPGMTVAAIDRLVHHSTIFEMNIESYRRRTASDKQTSQRRQLSSDNHKEGATTMAE